MFHDRESALAKLTWTGPMHAEDDDYDYDYDYGSRTEGANNGGEQTDLFDTCVTSVGSRG